jgi:hypothetical protein
VVFFVLLGTAIESANLVNQYAPLILLDGGLSSSAFTSEQLQALAYVPIGLQAVSYNISGVFFWILWPLPWIPGFRVALPSSSNRRAARDRGFVLPDVQLRVVSFTWIRSPAGALHPAALPRWRRIVLPLASDRRCERSAMD